MVPAHLFFNHNKQVEVRTPQATRGLEICFFVFFVNELRSCSEPRHSLLMIPYRIICIYIEAETRWTPVFRHFKCISLNANVWTSNKISLKFVPKCPITNIPALVQMMAWHLAGTKPLSESMMLSLIMHICVTRAQCVKDAGSPSNEMFHGNTDRSYVGSAIALVLPYYMCNVVLSSFPEFI